MVTIIILCVYAVLHIALARKNIRAIRVDQERSQPRLYRSYARQRTSAVFDEFTYRTEYLSDELSPWKVFCHVIFPYPFFFTTLASRR